MITKIPQNMDFDLNLTALPLIQQLIKQYQKYKVQVHRMEGVHVIDCGVHVLGGSEAGVLFASICMGGLGRIDIRWADFHGFRWPSVQVATDHPLQACIVSQCAEWPIYVKGFTAMGSGPGKMIESNTEIVSNCSSKKASEYSIVCLESEDLPSKEAIHKIIDQCQSKPENTYILIAPTASAVGSVQIAARALETALYKLKGLSFDLSTIQTGWGICPLPPVASDNLTALARTNDAILYGSTVYFNGIHDDDHILEQIVQEVPFSSTEEHGNSFADILKKYKDFYHIDPLLFSPSEIWLTNLKSGRTFHAGDIYPETFLATFGLQHLEFYGTRGQALRPTPVTRQN